MNCFETMFQMEPYVFCDENLSDYEKTIYILAIAYGASPIYRLSKKDIEELSLWLEVDFKLLAKALENEMNFITLEVRKSNTPAIRLYEKAGFEYVGIRPHFYTSPDEGAVIMTKNFNI